jgi:hypothetical protein
LRLPMPLSLFAAVVVLALATVGGALAAQALYPDVPSGVKAARTEIDRYRTLAWTYERAAHERRTPTSYSYRRSSDAGYLQWTLEAWQRHAYAACRRALSALRRRFAPAVPAAPPLHASLSRRIVFQRKVAVRLAGVSHIRLLSGARTRVTGRRALAIWQRRAARETLWLALHASRLTLIGPRWLTSAFICIHHYEGAWNADTGNGYYGGLQMDYGFMRRYGADFLRRWGTADRWPAWAQLQASMRAYRSGRGFWRWPRTARACGLL